MCMFKIWAGCTGAHLQFQHRGFLVGLCGDLADLGITAFI